jgi:drug/metabolite transporter (DMT)-like permease
VTTALGLFIAFLSGLAWAGLDVVRKSLTSELHPVVVATGMSMGAAALFGSAALLTDPQMDLGAYLAPGSLSTVLSIATQLLVLESVRRSALSRTIPMLSVTPVATALFGVAILGEKPSTAAWVGIVLVFAGALTLGLSRAQGATPTVDDRPGFDTGAALMLLAALSISAAAPFDKLAVQASTTLVHGGVQSFGASVALLGFLAARGGLGDLSSAVRARPTLAAAGCLAFAAIGLQFLAYRGALVGEVETIKRVVGLASSLGAGFFVFRESLSLKKLLAVAALAVGVTLILLGAG